MKQLLLLFIAISWYNLVTAQVEFAPVGARWTMDWIVFGSPTFYQIQPRVMECTGTEIIQNKVCKKIEGDFFCGGIAPPVYLYQEGGKVFFYSNTTSQFELLYNFDALPGESWTTQGYDLLNFFDESTMSLVDATTVTVLSLENIVLEGDTLLVQNVAFSNEGDWGTQFIEKIGSARGMFPRYGLCDGFYLTLRCYEDPDVEYHLPLDSSYFPSSVEIQYEPGYSCTETFQVFFTSQKEFAETPLSLSPNPFTATLHLRLPPAVASKPCRIRISDTAGKVLVTQDTKGKEEVIISTERLAVGMYFVTVEAEGYRGVEKIVKQE